MQIKFISKIIFLSLLISQSIISQDLKDIKIFANGIPKAGNHLLLKCLHLITNRRHHWVPGFAIINKNQIEKLQPKGILSAHAISSKENLELISKSDVKGFFILRDPRDQLIAKVHWVYREKNKDNKKVEEILMDLIKDGKNYNNPRLICEEVNHINGIGDYYNLFLGWLNCPNVYSVRFENIIGPLGGGNEELQYQEIQNIGLHLGLTLNKEDVKKVTDELFGKTMTFREGKIGSWKKYFNENHKQAFKKVAGQLLIDLGYEKDLNW